MAAEAAAVAQRVHLMVAVNPLRLLPWRDGVASYGVLTVPILHASEARIGEDRDS